MADVRKAEAELPPDLEAIRAEIAAHNSDRLCSSMMACCAVGSGEIANALLAEVERLGAELVHEQRVTLAYRSDGDVLRAEVERLRGVISEQQDLNLQLSYEAYRPNPSGE